MWAIFILGAVITAFITMILIWIGSKIYFSIKRENENFNSTYHVSSLDIDNEDTGRKNKE